MKSMEGDSLSKGLRSESMSLELINAAMGCLFLGIWLIVGHIIVLDYL